MLTYEADVLIPAALENAVTVDNARQIRAEVVVEAANGPTTPDAHDLLVNRGITVIPDILANAGGVTVSYFEWVQDRQGYFWSLQEVRQRLDQAMRFAFSDVMKMSDREKVRPRLAAYMLAVERVASATKLRGVYA